MSKRRLQGEKNGMIFWRTIYDCGPVVGQLNSLSNYIQLTMLQGKSNISAKSKQSQLATKRAQKFGKTNNSRKIQKAKPIDVDSEDQLLNNSFKSLKNEEVIELDKDSSNEDSSEISMEIIEKVAPQRHNQFNYDRLTKVSNAGPAVDISPKPFKLIELQVITDNEAINERERDALKTYSFLVEGHKLETNVRKIVLKDRAIMQTKAEALQLIKQNSVEEVKEVVKEDKKNQIENDDVEQKKNRYFQISHQICYRCGKEGHYAMNCIEEWNRKCKNCFSRDHEERNCPQICYECGAVGHISSQCPESREKRCQRCKKRGHVFEHCGVLLGDKTVITQLQESFTQSDVKKMKCIVEEDHTEQSKKGSHFNCFQYKNRSYPYQELRDGTYKSENVNIKKYQTEDNRRTNRFDRRGHDERERRQHSYGRERVHQHYQRRYQNEFPSNNRSNYRDRGQNRSSAPSNWDRYQGSQQDNYNRSRPHNNNNNRDSNNSSRRYGSKQYY